MPIGVQVTALHFVTKLLHAMQETSFRWDVRFKRRVLQRTCVKKKNYSQKNIPANALTQKYIYIHTKLSTLTHSLIHTTINWPSYNFLSSTYDHFLKICRVRVLLKRLRKRSSRMRRTRRSTRSTTSLAIFIGFIVSTLYFFIVSLLQVPPLECHCWISQKSMRHRSHTSSTTVFSTDVDTHIVATLDSGIPSSRRVLISASRSIPSRRNERVRSLKCSFACFHEIQPNSASAR